MQFVRILDVDIPVDEFPQWTLDYVPSGLNPGLWDVVVEGPVERHVVGLCANVDDQTFYEQWWTIGECAARAARREEVLDRVDPVHRHLRLVTS